jgi:hypothetical protein
MFLVTTGLIQMVLSELPMAYPDRPRAAIS